MHSLPELLVDHIVDVLTITLAIIAIVYAAIQKHESGKLLRSSSEIKKEADATEQNIRKHADEMGVQRTRIEELTGEMQAIASSMSTKYIGGFPKNMADVCQVVSLADRTLDIQVDLLAYGHYSNPDGFKRYMEALEDIAGKSPRTKVRMLVYGDDAAQKGRAAQFGGPGGFAEEMKSPRFERYFRQLYRVDNPPATYDEFVKIMGKAQLNCRAQLERYNAIEIRYASFPFRLFLWIEDEEEAVFAFELYGKNRTISFRTRDGNLIRTFRSVFEQNWEECAPKPVLQEAEKRPAQSAVRALPA